MTKDITNGAKCAYRPSCTEIPVKKALLGRKTERITRLLSTHIQQALPRCHRFEDGKLKRLNSTIDEPSNFKFISIENLRIFYSPQCKRLHDCI